MTAGYSGTPLPKKLGIKDDHRVGVVNPPSHLDDLLVPLPPNVTVLKGARGSHFDVVLLFARNPGALDRSLEPSIEKMGPSTALWVCWPKKSSPLATELDEARVRSTGLDSGLVDIKICAVDQDWSGLKFVYRVEDRPSVAATRLRKK